MSWKVVNLVHSRKFGSAQRKQLMAYFADKASDGGEGVFCSKATAAAETELARSTVYKLIDQLIEMRVLVEVGERSCMNGYVVVYDIDIAAVEALPLVKLPRTALEPVRHTDGSARRTGPSDGPHPSVPRTPTRPSDGPKPYLEPPLNLKESARVEIDADSALPDDPPTDPPADPPPPPQEAPPPPRPTRPAPDLTPGEGLVGMLTHALGFDHQGKIPARWANAVAPMVVSQWLTDLKLTPDEIVAVARGNARAHGSPANNPAILTPAMQDFAARKQAEPLTPTQGPGHERQNRPPRPDRRSDAATDALVRRVNAAARVAETPD